MIKEIKIKNINKHKIGDVINVQNQSPSFAYNNGLAVIKNISSTIMTLVKLDENGELRKYEDGTLSIFCTGINAVAFKTNLKYTFKK